MKESFGFGIVGIKVVRDSNLALQLSALAGAGILMDRYQPDQRFARTGDDDFLSGQGSVDELRKLCFGLVDIGLLLKW